MPEMRIDALNEISLVPATPVMAEEIYKTIVANRDHIGEFLPFAYLTKFPADTRAYLIERTADVVAGKEQVYAIQKAGKIIGMTDFHQYNPTDHRIELGYWLAQDYTRQGITTKVARAMCAFAFDELEVHQIGIFADVDNVGSNAVIKKAGFTFLARHPEYAHRADGYHDMNEYYLLEPKN